VERSLASCLQDWLRAWAWGAPMQEDGLLEQAESNALLAPGDPDVEPAEGKGYQEAIRVQQRLAVAGFAAVLFVAAACCWNVAPAGGPCRPGRGREHAAPGCRLLGAEASLRPALPPRGGRTAAASSKATLEAVPEQRRLQLDDSEALGCAEYNVVYRPLDMSGQAPSKESSVAACQARCADTVSCATYSYYLPEGHCHLQDAFAYPTVDNWEWLAGPSGCKMFERSPEIATILMYKNVCYQADVGYYALDMADVTPGWVPSVLECQRRCKYQPFCAHFTYNSISGTCHLASATAQPVRNPRSGNIAGPPNCRVSKEQLMEITLQRAAALCSAAGQDCRHTRCCSDRAMRCYERDAGWAACRASCKPHAGAWSCKPLGPHAGGGTPGLRPVKAPAPGKAAIAAVAPDGACAGEADQATWLRGGRESFEADMQQCAGDCLGAPFCVTQCIHKKGYSDSCARCFAGSSSCVVAHCLFQCMGGHESSACFNCSRDNCRPGFVKCSGFILLNASHL